MHRKYFETYNNYISQIYRDQFPGIDADELTICKNITFQITDDCCCACSYCYQTHKGHKMMSKETAKKAVDMMFDIYSKEPNLWLNGKTNIGVVLEFIGGEPLMNIDIIDYICTYFYERCIEEHHPWALTWRASMISNGKLYFEPKVQEFFKKFSSHISFNITLDGPEDIHDACRKYHDGTGNFKDALAALKHYMKNYEMVKGTKVTLAKENLKDMNKILDFFIDDLGMHSILGNPAFEPEWNYEDGKTYYKNLKIMADKLLSLPHPEDYYVHFFEENIGNPLGDDRNGNWCGGTGGMLAIDPDGNAYPCLRYMESSLAGVQEPIIIGHVDHGIYKTEQELKICSMLDSITRRSQSTDECYYCPVAEGCAWCSAYNYESMGTPNKRNIHICPMHKARVLANIYYWNRYYKEVEKDFTKHKALNLPKEDALNFISEEEYNMLYELSIN